MSTDIISVYIMYKFCSLFIFFQILGGGMAWSQCPPSGHGHETSTPSDQGEKIKKNFKYGGEGMIPLTPLSPLGPQLAKALRPQHQNGMTHQRPREKKIGELASTSPCHLLSSLRERQRSRRFRAM